MSGSTLLVTLLLLFFSIRKTKVHFQLLDYLLTGINTTLPAAFLSCYLLYRWQNNGTFFTETILFLLLSMLGLAASVLFISFLKLSSK
ncbi:hypothetical protein [Mucilaginibacter endophyticus]|uniref:hypothetical protein n=1 Tax=Mucilaginibacter endophyticus TaxID=2675003 RepID=UPI0012B17561|nr:hypothetical protein [Mucilaginibacter endophyticus]